MRLAKRPGGCSTGEATFASASLGQEMDWLPVLMRILRDELPNIEVTVSSQYSPDLAADLMRGKLDVASSARNHTWRI